MRGSREERNKASQLASGKIVIGDPDGIRGAMKKAGYSRREQLRAKASAHGVYAATHRQFRLVHEALARLFLVRSKIGL